MRTMVPMPHWGTQLEVLAGEGRIEIPVVGGTGQQVGQRSGQQLAAQFQLGSPVAIGHQTVVADAREARWQSVQQEAADELFGGDRHHLLLFR